MMGIKKRIWGIAGKILQANWYPNKKILLESVPDLSCQTYPVFRYMLKQGLNNEYKIIWFVYDKDKFKDVKIKNVFFRNYIPKNVFQKIQRLYAHCTARVILYSNRYIGKMFDKQIFIYLKHGTAIKSRLKHCRENETNECDFCITPSHFFDEIDEKELHIPKDRFISTGYPRNDFLFDDGDYVKKIYPDCNYDKVILWMPTFRKARLDNRIDSTFDFPLGLPCLYSESECIALNKTLSERNILLVLKPHPQQDMSVVTSLDLSNFKILTDIEIRNAGIQLYQFVGSTDALITDYSSIYYDYLLIHKPIGITTDDIDTYAKDTGFVFDNLFDVLVGEHINNVDEFISFVNSVADGKDDLLDKREAVSNMVHEHHDAKSAERVYNHIISELEKRYS